MTSPMTDPTRQGVAVSTYAADVPLICDPVPNGWRLVVTPSDRPLEAFITLLRWDDPLPADAVGWLPSGASRTEWPDAEFCAA